MGEGVGADVDEAVCAVVKLQLKLLCFNFGSWGGGD